MSENNSAIPAGEVFAQRMKAARETAGLSQAELSRRIAELGYELSRSQIADIENPRRAGGSERRRRVTLDDALAIAAALGVAPLHLIVPFEGTEGVAEDAADAGIFNPTKKLSIGKQLTLTPVEARRWITGRQLYPEADFLSHAERYYVVEVPPAKRWRVRQLRRAWEEKKDLRNALRKLPEDIEPTMVVGGGQQKDGTPRRLPTWAWVALQTDSKQSAGRRPERPRPGTTIGGRDADEE